MGEIANRLAHAQLGRVHWPRMLHPEDLAFGKSKLLLNDEWGYPFRYRPCGRVSASNGTLPGPDPIGEQILAPLGEGLGTWVPGKMGWQPYGNDECGWERKTPSGQEVFSGILVDYVEILSYGADGKPGGQDDNRDIVLRLYASSQYSWTLSRKGGEEGWNHVVKWRFASHE